MELVICNSCGSDVTTPFCTWCGSDNRTPKYERSHQENPPSGELNAETKNLFKSTETAIGNSENRAINELYSLEHHNFKEDSSIFNLNNNFISKPISIWQRPIAPRTLWPLTLFGIFSSFLAMILVLAGQDNNYNKSSWEPSANEVSQFTVPHVTYPTGPYSISDSRPLENRSATVVQIICGKFTMIGALVSIDIGPTSTAVISSADDFSRCSPDKLMVSDGVSSIQSSLAMRHDKFIILGVPLPLGKFGLNLIANDGAVEVVTLLNGSVNFTPSSIVAKKVLGEHQSGSLVVSDNLLIGIVGPSGSLLDLSQLCGPVLKC